VYGFQSEVLDKQNEMMFDVTGENDSLETVQQIDHTGYRTLLDHHHKPVNKGSQEEKNATLLADMLWSDPDPDMELEDTIRPNDERGNMGSWYGEGQIKRWLKHVGSANANSFS